MLLLLLTAAWRLRGCPGASTYWGRHPHALRRVSGWTRDFLTLRKLSLLWAVCMQSTDNMCKALLLLLLLLLQVRVLLQTSLGSEASS